MRKIALISEHASPLAQAGSVDSGGQNVYVGQLAKSLARDGISVDVFTRRDNSLLPPVVHWFPNVRIFHVPAGPARFVAKEKLLGVMPAFSDWLGNFVARQPIRYDVFHANFFMSGHAALPVARASCAPLVMTFHALGRVRRQHQGQADGFPECRVDIETELVRVADRTLAECPQDRDDLLGLYGADPERISVVPCGFDPEEFAAVPRAEARRALGWDTDEFTVLQLGRLVPRKGIENVVRGIAALRDRHGIRARLQVVGGNAVLPNAIATPEIARLRGIADTVGVADQVDFVGRRTRDTLKTFYSAADVFVTTPLYEPFGITPLEAMACGTPVIASDVGGLRSTVLEGRTGLLVPPEDPKALADALATLERDAPLRQRFGEQGRRHVHRLYTWRRVARQIGDIYESLLADDGEQTANGLPGELAVAGSAVPVLAAGASL